MSEQGSVHGGAGIPSSLARVLLVESGLHTHAGLCVCMYMYVCLCLCMYDMAEVELLRCWLECCWLSHTYRQTDRHTHKLNVCVA